MFDFAWSEIALIGVVALIAIGPKDMPVAIKAVSDTIKRMRRMAGEFQGHVDEMMREADLGDVKSSINELRSLNLKNTMQRAIDPDGSLNRAFDDPFRPHRVPPVITQPAQRHDAAPASPAAPSPDFIPPGAKAPALIQPAYIPPAPVPPPFLPPAVTAPHYDGPHFDHDSDDAVPHGHPEAPAETHAEGPAGLSQSEPARHDSAPMPAPDKA